MCVWVKVGPSDFAVTRSTLERGKKHHRDGGERPGGGACGFSFVFICCGIGRIKTCIQYPRVSAFNGLWLLVCVLEALGMILAAISCFSLFLMGMSPKGTSKKFLKHVWFV